jgi:hypothetical protein
MTEQDIQLIENDANLVKEQVDSIIYASEVVLTKLAEIERNRTYFGKTIQAWCEYFDVQIDETADPIRLKQYAAQINERLNKAYLYKSKTKRFLTDYLSGYDKQKNELIESHATNRTRKTIPAADTLEKVAASQMGDKTVIITQLQNSVDFWQDMIYKLNKTMDLIRIMSMSNGTMARLEAGLL